MRQTSILNTLGPRISLGQIRLALDPGWLLVLPGGLWALLALYLPILGGNLSPASTWAAALLILLLAGLSLLAHMAAHMAAHRFAGRERPANPPDGPPQDVSLLLFGDAAQSWVPAATPWGEARAALAGICANLLLAGLAYALWNVQLHPVLNLSLLFTCFFNLWLAVINLIPAFPFDGGRLARAAFSGISQDPQTPTRLSVVLGFGAAVFLISWGLFLFFQHKRFSGQTGAVTLGFALLILDGLRTRPALDLPKPAQVVPAQKPARRLLRLFRAVLLAAALFAAASSLLLTNDGLEAPGLALSVEPMVAVPAEHSHPPQGTFILTSVIPQAPITAGEWLVGQLSPAVKIVPPATIVPENTTPQEIARQGFRMLDESESTAIVVGLQQAGFDAAMVGKGVRVVSLLADSPSQGLILPDDVIVGLNGTQIRSPNALVDRIHSQEPGATVHLQVQRGQDTLELQAPLMPPEAPGEAPKLGIVIEPAGSEVSLPFPVQIVSQKIVGGPSAGLMFALTVYNLVTPDDLTGGRKIAGTGTINPDGSVGPIGGVEQKVAAAELAGASYFLSPPDNYAAALSAARRIRVVEIASIGQAIDFLHNLPPP